MGFGGCGACGCGPNRSPCRCGVGCVSGVLHHHVRTDFLVLLQVSLEFEFLLFQLQYLLLEMFVVLIHVDVFL